MGELKLEKLDISFGRQTIIRDFSLTVADGEMVSILGPSGAGKTTILKAIAGLIQPTAGQIMINGRSVLDLPPEKRDAIMVFQKPLLFPFMDVSQNISFGLRMQGCSEADMRLKIENILELTQLKGLERRKIHQLSGGQQQRVSLARALVLEPSVLLLDEPLSNLDANLRQQMRDLILEIQGKTRVTTLFVTHDQSEALMMSHRVTLLLDGRLRQTGRPRDLFNRPVDPEVARFFGGINFFKGRFKDGRFHTDFGTFQLSETTANGNAFMATIRPEDILISPENDFEIEGRVEKTSFEGIATRVWVKCREKTLVVLTTGADFNPGQSVRLRLPPGKIRVFLPEKAI